MIVTVLSNPACITCVLNICTMKENPFFSETGVQNSVAARGHWSEGTATQSAEGYYDNEPEAEISCSEAEEEFDGPTGRLQGW